MTFLKNERARLCWWLRALTLITFLASSRAAEHPLIFSTFFGGSYLDSFNAVTTDSAGNIYCAGWSWSADFPTTNAFQTELQGPSDCVLVKFDAGGKLIFSTYFGGSSEDGVEAITVDSSGDIWIAGFAHSADLLTTEGAFQMDYAGGSAFGNGDGFVAKFSNDGSELLYCTYLGGSGDDLVTDLQLDAGSSIVLCGTTDSPNFFNATLFGVRGKQDGYIVRLAPDGATLLDATLIAGNDTEESLRLDLGNNGTVYFSGATYSTNFYTTDGAQDRVHAPAWGSRDGFFGLYAPGDTNLHYLSYFGSGSDEGIFDLAVRNDGSVVITGVNGTLLSATNGVFQPQPGFGPDDAFVGVLRPPHWDFEWISYLGGSGGEAGYKIALDSQENIFVIGETDSSDFPLRDALGSYGGGETDPFVAKISRDGATLLYSTHLGGASNDRAWSAAIGPEDSIVMVGWAASDDFPLRNAFMVAAPFLDTHAFVTRIHPGPVPFLPEPPPPLEIAQSGTKMVVSWPETAEAVVLERSTIVRTLHWTPIEGNPVSLGGRKSMILDNEDGTVFFRLRRLQIP